MFTYTNTAFRFDELLKNLAVAINTTVSNNRIVLPTAVGKGYFQAEQLPNQIWVMFFDIELYTDWIFKRPALEEDFYTLRFETAEIETSLTTKIDGEAYKNTSEVGNYAYLTCSMNDMEYIISKGTVFHAIHIRLPREIMKDYFKMETYDSILLEYLSLKSEALTIEPLDAEYKMIMEEIKNLNANHPVHNTIVLNRVMYMMERFFTSLYNKRQQLHFHVKVSNDDIDQVRKVEAVITKDFGELCPTINELAKLANMSPSKLKQLFKNVYGKPIYQYYQQSRMLKAKTMLLSKQYSIKEVGMSLGYANLSNFSTAFRKEFNMLPSEFVKEEKSR